MHSQPQTIGELVSKLSGFLAKLDSGGITQNDSTDYTKNLIAAYYLAQNVSDFENNVIRSSILCWGSIRRRIAGEFYFTVAEYALLLKGVEMISTVLQKPGMSPAMTGAFEFVNVIA